MIRPVLAICLVLVASGCASPPDRDREAAPSGAGSAHVWVDLAPPFLPHRGRATSDPRVSERPSQQGRTSGPALVVSPRGTATAEGRVDSTLDLGTALGAKSPVRPGGTILLRGGTYKGAFVSRISGTQADPIVVRSFPGEWAVLDGGTAPASTLDVQGADVWFRDFEVMKSDPDRTSRYGTNAPPDVSRARWSGVWVEGIRTKLINLVVHDNGDGIGIWRRSESSEVYGCILFNNGWLGADHAWGHGIYAQNAVGTKTIEDNIVFNNFGWGIHAYDRLGPIVGFDIDGNTSFENGTPVAKTYPNVLVGSEQAATDRISLTRSIAYHRPGGAGTNVLLGYLPALADTEQRRAVVVRDNHVAGGNFALVLRGWTDVAVERNEIVAHPSVQGWPPVLAQLLPNRGISLRDDRSQRWDHNRYRTTGDVSATTFRLTANGQDRAMSFNEWRNATGFDASGDHSTALVGQNVSMRPNRYTRGRGALTVLNWSQRPSVAVDLKPLRLKIGERFEIRDVQNLSGKPVASGVYSGAKVTIPLTSTAVTQPIGGSPVRLTHTSREFGSFLVLPAPAR